MYLIASKAAFWAASNWAVAPLDSKSLISALKIYDDIPDAWNYLLSNVIELNEEDLIFDINNKNLENVEKTLFDKK